MEFSEFEPHTLSLSYKMVLYLAIFPESMTFEKCCVCVMQLKHISQLQVYKFSILEVKKVKQIT